jgi:AraC-like DNA-binding protein
MTSAASASALWFGMDQIQSSAFGVPLPDGNGDRPQRIEVWKARKFIREHLDEKISLTEVAAAVRISPTYLSEKFKQSTGENFVCYVARSRVEKACELLRKSEARISEIAFATGFQSLSQFNRVFKKFLGEAPRAYRVRFCNKNGNGMASRNGGSSNHRS